MLSNRLKKLILLRLLFAASLLFCPKVYQEGWGIPFYASAVAICFLSIGYLGWFLGGRRFRQFAMVQVFLDIVVVTQLVLVTGGADSLFAVVYPLNILSAALVLGEKRFVFATTIISCASYVASSILVYPWREAGAIPSHPILFFYSVGLKVAIFLAIGYLSRYLSGMVRELENRLKLSERLSSLGEVVSKIAHEVRNPLSSIKTAAEVLRASLGGRLDTQQEKMLSVVEIESDRLTQTLQRILDYTKQVRLNPRTLALDGLIDRSVTLVRLNSRVRPEGISIDKRYDQTKTRVYADEEQIIGVFLNLMLNAFQAMPEGGRLEIHAEEGKEGTAITLRDCGQGIPPDKVKELFQPFKSNKKGGTGLGLAEVYKIITLHEGRIDVESQLGKGTAFRLFFPKP